MLRCLIAAGMLIAATACASAQDRGTMNPKPLPPLANPNDPATPAKELFGRALSPADLAARSIGFYSRGCYTGGVQLVPDGPTWQAMRLSRNRNWGTPQLVAFIQRFSASANNQVALRRIACSAWIECSSCSERRSSRCR